MTVTLGIHLAARPIMKTNHVVLFPEGAPARIIAWSIVDKAELRQTVTEARKANPHAKVWAMWNEDADAAMQLHDAAQGF